MPVKTRSLRQEQLERSTRLREEGRTWVEIAEVFGRTYGLNPRNSLRLAHGWSQREAADLWNERWPDDPKTFKNFSYWEMWPSATGYTPSLEVLTKLAELYECNVADLLVDCPDYRRLDHANQAKQSLESIAAIVDGTASGGDGHSEAAGELSGLVDRVEAVDVHELGRAASSWAQSIEPDSTRRALLLKLSAGLALAATLPAAAWADNDDGPPASEPALGPTFAGIWHSTYTYFSTGRNQMLQGEHYVLLSQNGKKVAGQSLPHTNGSRLTLQLSVEEPVATGTWTERTSPTGHYRGAAYHGALQLLIDPMDRSMTGKWVGFGKDFQINTGDWKLRWLEGSASKEAQLRYRLRA